ncbi:MAG: ORF6C domain-containing protein [Anaerolinea sp.]|nr:ORF6C domain-containing protein [Anaerolinea sp.]
MSDLIPVEQRTVLFYDDEITAVVVQSGAEHVVYVPLRPICDYLGLDWSAQTRRIQRDDVLADVVMSVAITATDIDPDSRRPRTSDMLAIRLEFLNGWLFGVNARRVKPEIRAKLLAYQRECYTVLARHFTAVSPAPSSASSALMQVREMGLAIVRMAEEQMEFDRRLAGAETAVSGLDVRVQALEARLEPPAHAVTNEQASQISQAAKAVAIALGKQTKRNEFGGVYGEMYRKFGITSYKLLPARRFDEVMRWLSEWHQSLTSDDSPF